MPLEPGKKQDLLKKAKLIREEIIKITEICGGSHIGGALSQTDIMVYLYYHLMNFDPKNPNWEDRDRFILSKGHGGVGHAAILGDLGCFDKKQLDDFNKTHSPFGMHLDANKVAGVDASTGSLGHGPGIGIGMAIGARLQNKKWHTYCMVGDGECNEGSVWEAAMAGAHYKVTNFTLIVDRNDLMIDGPTEKIMALEPLDEKFKSFGWNVIEIDGHDFDQIADGLEKSLSETEKPTVILARTVKGKCVDFMEGGVKWHYAGLDSEASRKALDSVDRYYSKLL